MRVRVWQVGVRVCIYVPHENPYPYHGYAGYRSTFSSDIYYIHNSIYFTILRIYLTRKQRLLSISKTVIHVDWRWSSARRSEWPRASNTPLFNRVELMAPFSHLLQLNLLPLASTLQNIASSKYHLRQTNSGLHGGRQTAQLTTHRHTTHDASQQLSHNDWRQPLHHTPSLLLSPPAA